MRLSKRHMDDMYDMREIYINEDRYEHAFCIDSLIELSDGCSKGKYDDVYLAEFSAILSDIASSGPPVDAEVAFEVSVILDIDIKS